MAKVSRPEVEIDPHNLNDAIFAHVQRCNSISSRLSHLSYGLSVVGLEKLADELSAIADDLPESAKVVQQAYSLQLNSDLADSERMTGLLLSAALAGAIREPSKPA